MLERGRDTERGGHREKEGQKGGGREGVER